MDIFYTRNSLAEQIEALSENEVRIIGTMRLNYVDAANKKLIERAIQNGKRDPAIHMGTC